MPDQVPHEVVQERYERLVAVVNQIAWDENKALVGRVVELLVSAGDGRKDAATHRLSGRARDNRLVHFSACDDGDTPPPRPGDFATVEITYAAPHHLVSDARVRAVRRTRAGDAWALRESGGRRTVPLGLPTVGPPATEHDDHSNLCRQA
jgi:tRNA-2-methylthio-N6-dimethylallyladenosine synthase